MEPLNNGHVWWLNTQGTYDILRWLNTHTLRASEHAHVLEGSPWHDLRKEGDVFLQCGGRLVANVLVSFQVQVRLIDLDDVA